MLVVLLFVGTLWGEVRGADLPILAVPVELHDDCVQAGSAAEVVPVADIHVDSLAAQHHQSTGEFDPEQFRKYSSDEFILQPGGSTGLISNVATQLGRTTGVSLRSASDHVLCSGDPETGFRYAKVEDAALDNTALSDFTPEGPAPTPITNNGLNNTGISGATAARVINALENRQGLSRINGVILDEATRLPVSACVKVTDQTDTAAQGTLPGGFWCDGSFSTPVTSGTVSIEVSKGRFYPRYMHTIPEVLPETIVPFSVTVGRQKAWDFAAQGWYLADLDIGLRAEHHENPVWLGTGPELEDLIQAARAEDVHILGVPIPSKVGNEIQDLEHCNGASDDNLLLLPVFRGPRHIFHGCALGLGVTSCRDLRQEMNAPEIPLFDSFEEIHACGGLAIFTQLKGWSDSDLQSQLFPLFPALKESNYYGRSNGSARLYSASELVYDTLIGPTYDALAFDGSELAERLWFNLLNNGYTIPIVGAVGGSLEAGRVPSGQTFIHLDSKPTRDNVLRAVKQGHTSISFGPAVFCKILERNADIGSILKVDGRDLTLQVQAFATQAPGAQLDRIEIIRNGVLFTTQRPGEGETMSELRVPIRESSAAWYVVRVSESQRKGGKVHQTGKAWSNPIYFKNTNYVAPTNARSIIKGVLHAGLSPVKGTVTAFAPGELVRQISTNNEGRFKIEVSAAGTLVFEAQNCVPVAKRVIEHPKIQQAFGSFQLLSGDQLLAYFSQPELFARWRLFLSELELDVTLSTSGSADLK